MSNALHNNKNHVVYTYRKKYMNGSAIHIINRPAGITIRLGKTYVWKKI